MTYMIVMLMAVSSAAGLWIPGLYRDAPATEAMFRGYDLVSLIIVSPGLLAATLLTRRGSARARLIWAGLLAYGVYGYAFYVFGTAFNDVFLAHVAVFTLSVAALVLALANLDVVGIANSFGERTPVRTVSVLLLLLAVPIGAFWVFFSLRMAVTDQPPADTLLVQSQSGLHLAYVLDLALLVVPYVLAAVLLWRRAPWGYVAAAVLSVSGLVHQLSYIAALAFQAQAEVPGSTAFDPQEPVIVAVFLIALTLLLVNLPSRKRAARARAVP
ncbi:hypothetical protein O1R50_14775 [Glycomyces luteolus]|uniref:Uncharacterized protein n=1 Tax=Glycomyces luteolus TaxID=2670330 RepID=A0A9X3P9L5_9ACTN|nr:hypothetical protein [Glycomyces luteolus]MDA1360892.1 hypothetical protein [Glycomyces luteolus]